MDKQIAPLQPFRLADYPDEVTALFLAAKTALLRQHADLVAEKMALQADDGKGGRLPFDRNAISDDNRRWLDQQQGRVDALAAALAPFGYKL